MHLFSNELCMATACIELQMGLLLVWKRAWGSILRWQRVSVPKFGALIPGLYQCCWKSEGSSLFPCNTGVKGAVCHLMILTRRRVCVCKPSCFMLSSLFVV